VTADAPRGSIADLSFAVARTFSKLYSGSPCPLGRMLDNSLGCSEMVSGTGHSPKFIPRHHHLPEISAASQVAHGFLRT